MTREGSVLILPSSVIIVTIFLDVEDDGFEEGQTPLSVGVVT